ncbi:hypothetical protein BKA62DRAFT_718088 [Auriculariales sp. MPI-PUGE-AT-0066]|nr:hypothetical protein BKA62DRAFT_718088 [Auriculariales sp. MPI-PUGE-AT-0066]
MPTMSLNIPDDVILSIFDALAGPARISWPKDEYDVQRAKAPYRLASVCRRWRNLALGTSALWTYFGFPHGVADQKGHLIRLDDLISRSSQAAIDVLFIGRHMDEYGQDALYIFRALYDLAPRWRTVQLHVFYLYSFGQKLEIPRAPRLTRLCLKTPQTGKLKFSSTLPSMRTLIMFTPDSVLTQLVCKAYAEQLVDLCISEDFLDPTFGPISCPRLRNLVTDDARYLSRFRAPGLRTLSVNATRLGKFPPSPDVEFPSVDHLVLYGTVTPMAINVFRRLTFISRLSFAIPAEIAATLSVQRHVTFDETFFPALATSVAFQRLAHISITSNASVHYNELTAFLISRTSIVLDCKSIPDEFRDKLQQYIMHPTATGKFAFESA